MMNVIIRILIFNSFVYFLKADEEANFEESKSVLKEHSSGEVGVVTPKTWETEHKNISTRRDATDNLDDILKNNEISSVHNTEHTVIHRFTAYLKDPSTDEIFKAAKISIELKDSSGDKRGKEVNKTQNKEESIEIADTRRKTKEIVKNEPDIKSTTQNNEGISTLIEEDIISSVKNSLNHVTKNAVANTELRDKISTTVLQKPTSMKSSTLKPIKIDDMGDLTFPSDLDKFRENDKAENDDTSPHAGDTELDDFRATRRMMDYVPVLDYKARPGDLEPSVPISTSSKSPPGAVEEISTSPLNIFSSLTLPNKNVESVPYRLEETQSPLYNYNEANSKLFNNLHQENHPLNKLTSNNPNRMYSNSQEILFNPNRFNNEDKILNEPNRFGNSMDIANNPIINRIPNRFSNSNEEVNGPNRMGQVFPRTWNPGMINVPNRWELPQRIHDVRNTWMPRVTFPNTVTKQPIVLNSPRWLQPGILNRNGFHPGLAEAWRNTRQSQETADSPELESNYLAASDFTPLDSNAYPYILSRRVNMAEDKINPTFRKLVQATKNPLNPNLPILGTMRYSYPPFDPKLYYAQRNLEMLIN